LPLESREQDAPEDALRSPLDDIFVDFLMSKKRESPDLDFKLTVDVSRYRFSDVAKDIFAMANYGGGYILIGFKQKETGGFEPVGVPPDFHVDQADLQQKFNAYCSDPLDIGYREFDYEVKEESGQLVIHKFALINAPPSTTALSPKNDGIVRSPDGREKTVFRRGEVLIRRGTQSTRASPAEVEWIKKRAEDAEYRISLISGNTDRISEKLHSNLFEVAQLPHTIFSAKLSVEQLPFSEIQAAFVVQNPFIYTFDDPTEEPLKRYVQRATLEKHKTEDWLRDRDRRNLVLWLLDSTLIWESRGRGMYRSGKRLFFPLREGETERRESWPGMTRESSRIVATMMFAKQVGEKVGLHPAVEVHFVQVGEKLYLRLTPTYVLTWDGRKVRRGEQEGTVITSLSHDDYNALYLRNLFFWVSKLGGADGRIRVLNRRIEINAEPCFSRVEVGIRADRPTLTTIKLGGGQVGGE